MFKVKDEDENKSYKLMSSNINDEKALEKFKTIWVKIEDLVNIKLNALPAYDVRHIKAKTVT